MIGHGSLFSYSCSCQLSFSQQNALNFSLDQHNLGSDWSSLSNKTWSFLFIQRMMLKIALIIWYRLDITKVAHWDTVFALRSMMVHKHRKVTHGYTVLVLAGFIEFSLITYALLFIRDKVIQTARVTNWNTLLATWQELIVNLCKFDEQNCTFTAQFSLLFIQSFFWMLWVDSLKLICLV